MTPLKKRHFHTAPLEILNEPVPETALCVLCAQAKDATIHDVFFEKLVLPSPADYPTSAAYDIRVDGHTFQVTKTARTGSTSGRPLWRVVCLTCNREIHPGSTSERAQIRYHLDEVQNAEDPSYFHPDEARCPREGCEGAISPVNGRCSSCREPCTYVPAGDLYAPLRRFLAAKAGIPEPTPASAPTPPSPPPSTPASDPLVERTTKMALDLALAQRDEARADRDEVRARQKATLEARDQARNQRDAEEAKASKAAAECAALRTQRDLLFAHVDAARNERDEALSQRDEARAISKEAVAALERLEVHARRACAIAAKERDDAIEQRDEAQAGLARTERERDIARARREKNIWRIGTVRSRRATRRSRRETQLERKSNGSTPGVTLRSRSATQCAPSSPSRSTRGISRKSTPPQRSRRVARKRRCLGASLRRLRCTWPVRSERSVRRSRFRKTRGGSCSLMSARAATEAWP